MRSYRCADCRADSCVERPNQLGRRESLLLVRVCVSGPEAFSKAVGSMLGVPAAFGLVVAVSSPAVAIGHTIILRPKFLSQDVSAGETLTVGENFARCYGPYERDGWQVRCNRKNERRTTDKIRHPPANYFWGRFAPPTQLAYNQAVDITHVPGFSNPILARSVSSNCDECTFDF